MQQESGLRAQTLDSQLIGFPPGEANNATGVGVTGPLTFDMEDRVMSERGVGTGVAEGGAEAAGAGVREALHTSTQQLWKVTGRSKKAGRLWTNQKKKKRTGKETDGGSENRTK